MSSATLTASAANNAARRGNTLGRGSDTWKYWAELRAGNITEHDWVEIEGGIARSPGHCMTMGTASTMTSAIEAMGLSLSGSASIPAADSRHAQMATLSGKQVWWCTSMSAEEIVLCRYACGLTTTPLRPSGNPARIKTLTRASWPSFFASASAVA